MQPSTTLEGSDPLRVVEGCVPVDVEPRLHWIVPNVVAPGAGAPPRGRFVLRSRDFARRPLVEIAQDGRTLWEGHVTRLVPGRSARLPHAWTAAVDPSGGPVRVRLASRG